MSEPELAVKPNGGAPPEPIWQELPMDVRHSAEIGELAGALALAQLDFKPVLKESDNPFYKSKYADLANVIAATQPALAKNGLVVIQCPHLSSQQMTLTTLLVHKSGQWLASDL